MNSMLRIFSLFSLGLVLLYGCYQPPHVADAQIRSAHTSQSALDWKGLYRGKLPCADCEGIATTITLMENDRFIRNRQYLGKEQTPQTDQGTFAWIENGSTIVLVDQDGHEQAFQVGERMLRFLDRQGEPITGPLAQHYVLHKAAHDPQLEDKTWTLVSLMGNTVDLNTQRHPAELRFDPLRSLVTGSTSCNRLTGSYVVDRTHKISFGALSTTMMSCPNLDIEASFTDALRYATRYEVQNNTLKLFRKDDSVAVFQTAQAR